MWPRERSKASGKHYSVSDVLSAVCTDAEYTCAMLDCVRKLRAADGGYANQVDLPQGLTPSTAAAVTVFRYFQQPLAPELGQWLLSRCR